MMIESNISGFFSKADTEATLNIVTWPQGEEGAEFHLSLSSGEMKSSQGSSSSVAEVTIRIQDEANIGRFQIQFTNV